MNLGEKLKQARLDAGLSQRQLCADVITRNMLSQIENGAARPSMKTLQYLAARLGKSVSYFLDEPNMVSPNHSLMSRLREHYDNQEWSAAAPLLDDYLAPDPLFDREYALIYAEICLSLAEQAILQGRDRYALELLSKADIPLPYCRDALTRRRLLLLGQLPDHAVSSALPSLDGELLLRAEEAFHGGSLLRAGQLLSALEEKQGRRYHWLQGLICFQQQEYAQAAEHFLKANDIKSTAPMLERCYKELGDYKQAYEYACLQKEK